AAGAHRAEAEGQDARNRRPSGAALCRASAARSASPRHADARQDFGSEIGMVLGAAAMAMAVRCEEEQAMSDLVVIKVCAHRNGTRGSITTGNPANNAAPGLWNGTPTIRTGGRKIRDGRN